MRPKSKLGKLRKLPPEPKWLKWPRSSKSMKALQLSSSPQPKRRPDWLLRLRPSRRSLRARKTRLRPSWTTTTTKSCLTPESLDWL